MKQVLFSALFILLVSIVSLSQINKKGTPHINKYTIDDYSPEEHRASLQNRDIYQDSSGVLFLGIQTRY